MWLRSSASRNVRCFRVAPCDARLLPVSGCGPDSTRWHRRAVAVRLPTTAASGSAFLSRNARTARD
jgi:hypothetical protein